MMDRLLALVVDEGKWLAASMGLALICVAVLLLGHRGPDVPTRRRVAAAMNLFFGVTVGTMAFGHLLAVTTKLALGTLRDGSLLAFYAIGAAVAAPSWWLILHTRRLLREGDDVRRTVALNGWLALTLLALGLHNLPLAIPAAFNIGHQLHGRPAVGWAMVGLSVLFNIGLFVGAVVFLMSGQSFEQFSGTN
jgi:hypothetical protein